MYKGPLIILISEILLCNVGSSIWPVNTEEYRMKKNTILFPGENDEEIVGYLSTVEERIFKPRPEENISDIVYFIYYSREYPEGKNISDLKDLSTYFNKTKKTKVIIHGWLSSSRSDMCSEIKSAYLNTLDVNVIVTDWNSISRNVLYFVAAQSVTAVANYCAEALDYLIEDTNANPRDFHIIGHSLGAQIAGFTGRNLKRGRIGRITGLDPALPLFHALWAPDTDNDTHLNPNDSDFVDIIHTCAGILGARQPVGHVDFYPNGGGPPQPGCTWIKFIEACSHGRSWKLWKESILLENAFVANQCPSLHVLNDIHCAGRDIPMGENTPPSARGVYYLKTSGTAPYVWKWNSTSIFSNETAETIDTTEDIKEDGLPTDTDKHENIQLQPFIDTETKTTSVWENKNYIDEKILAILKIMQEDKGESLADIKGQEYIRDEPLINTEIKHENKVAKEGQNATLIWENKKGIEAVQFLEDLKTNQQNKEAIQEEKGKLVLKDEVIIRDYTPHTTIASISDNKDDMGNPLVDTKTNMERQTTTSILENKEHEQESELLENTKVNQENQDGIKGEQITTDIENSFKKINIKEGIGTLKLEDKEYNIKYIIKNVNIKHNKTDKNTDNYKKGVNEGIVTLKLGSIEYIIKYDLIEDVENKEEHNNIKQETVGTKRGKEKNQIPSTKHENQSKKIISDADIEKGSKELRSGQTTTSERNETYRIY